MKLLLIALGFYILSQKRNYYIDQSTILLDLLNNRWRCRNSYTRIGHSLYRDLHSDVTLTNCEVV